MIHHHLNTAVGSWSC